MDASPHKSSNRELSFFGRLVRPLAWGFSTRLVLFALFLGIGSVAVVGSLPLGPSGLAPQEGAREFLTSPESRAETSEGSGVETAAELLRKFARNRMVVKATRDFIEGFRAIAEELGEGSVSSDQRPRRSLPESAAGRWLNSIYIANNPFSLDSKHLLDVGDEDCSYNDAHERYHPVLRAYMESAGFLDLALLDLEGNLIYTVRKNSDYATNCLVGPYRESPWAHAYRQALSSTTPGEAFRGDGDLYEPEGGEPARFIAAPVFDADDRVGVALFRLP